MWSVALVARTGKGETKGKAWLQKGSQKQIHMAIMEQTDKMKLSRCLVTNEQVPESNSNEGGGPEAEQHGGLHSRSSLHDERSSLTSCGYIPESALHGDRTRSVSDSKPSPKHKTSGRSKKKKEEEDVNASLLTHDFEKVPAQVREMALTALHGVPDLRDENPFSVEDSLRKLDIVIGQRKGNRQAYDKALFLNPYYVENRDFRLMFLRCERFDIHKATDMIMNHFKVKLELFGEECLARDIIFGDLDETTAEAHLSGALWFTRNYDSAGRRLFSITTERMPPRNSIHYFRVAWYNAMNALKDERTQKNGGTIVVSAGGGANASSDRNEPLEVPEIHRFIEILKSLPLFWGGIHFCYEDKAVVKQVYLKPLKLAQMELDAEFRMKFRIHRGSLVEIKFSLLRYGIPAESLPLGGKCDLLDTDFKEESTAQKASEDKFQQFLACSKVVACPAKQDILLGRGRPYQEFPGNVMLHSMVEIRRADYERRGKTEKSEEVVELLQQILSGGSRFLRRAPSPQPSSSPLTETGCCWEIVDFETARRKVSNCFHTRKRRAGEQLSRSPDKLKGSPPSSRRGSR